MVGVFKNACYLIVEKAAFLLTSLILLVLVAHGMGVEGLGRYTFAISLASLVMPLLDLGLNSRIIKGIAASDALAPALRPWAIRVKLMVAPVAVALPAVFAWVSGRSPELLVALVLLGISSVAISIGDVGNSVFKGRERMAYSAAITVFWNTLLLAGCWGALLAGWGLIGLTAAYVVARGSYAIVATRLSREGLPLPVQAASRISGKSLLIKSILSLPAGYYLMTLFNLSLVLVALKWGDLRGAEYALGQRLMAALFIVSTGGIEAVFPALSRRFARNPQALRRPLAGAAVVLLLLSTLASGVVSFAAEPGVNLLFSPVPGAVPVIHLVVWAVPPFALCALFHYALVASNRERTAFISINIVVLAGAAINAWAIWRWGMLGGGLSLVLWGLLSAVFSGLLVLRVRRDSASN